ncbi:hypothetical protein [Dictyobacter aurantiacus]|uniref:HEPN domain-containing protein n=1 Tax=Dictyobacter aurantiacus TaxID=1936993 RepID=A0A401Z9W6_9CHLR|nr:hypothetical protein [Dictyobacter aurantiacus]GCE03645.1 hypothetical protein KDAU_09740 [Dictyobacter aurantiacus]
MDDASSESLLFHSSSLYGNVVLNFQPSAMNELGVYARAFHNAGQKLAEAMFSLPGYHDIDACPIVFLYRHSLELCLKAIVYEGFKIERLDNENHPFPNYLLTQHKLSQFIDDVRKTFNNVGYIWETETEEMRTFNDFVRFVKEFDSVDAGSYTFRYPIKKDAQASVPPHFIFHVPAFCQYMDALLETLEAALTGIQLVYDQRSEIMCDQRPGEMG